MKQLTKIVLVVVFTISHIQTLNAQNFDDNVQDVPVSSIDQWILPLIAIIIAFVYMILKAKTTMKGFK
jgi:hypothetical protein